MPVIALPGGRWGLWGLGQTALSTQNQQAVPVSYGYLDGLKLWKNFTQVGEGFKNIGVMIQQAPTAALGFLTPPVLGALLLFGSGFGGGYYRARKRYRTGNPRKRGKGFMAEWREKAYYLARAYGERPGRYGGRKPKSKRGQRLQTSR